MTASAAEAESLDKAHWVGNSVGPGRHPQHSEHYMHAIELQAQAQDDKLMLEADGLYQSHELGEEFVPYDESHMFSDYMHASYSVHSTKQYAVGSSTNMEQLSR